MATSIVASILIGKIKYSKIYVVGINLYSQNTFLAIQIDASGCKKCSHIQEANKLAYSHKKCNLHLP